MTLLIGKIIMIHRQLKDIKRAQKESFLLKELAQLFIQIQADEFRLDGLYINHVKLSPKASSCEVFFWTQGGKKDFDEKLPILILYKPSIRTALAKMRDARYVPDLTFRYDVQFEKQSKIEALLDKIKEEDKEEEAL